VGKDGSADPNCSVLKTNLAACSSAEDVQSAAPGTTAKLMHRRQGLEHQQEVRPSKEMKGGAHEKRKVTITPAARTA